MLTTRSILGLSATLLFACSDCDETPEPSASPAPAPSAPAEPAEAVPVEWTRLDPPAGEGALGADLEVGDENVVATWLEPLDGDGHALRLSTLTGARWSSPSTIAQGEALVANWADFPRSTRGGDGALYVHLLQKSGDSPYAYEVRLLRSEDGERFEPLGVVHQDRSPTEHGFVSMVPVPEGVRLFWLDGRATAGGGATAVYTALAGEAIGSEAPVDERACDCCQTDAAVGADGPIVAFRDRDDNEHRDIAVARLEGERFGASQLVHADGWEIAGCPVNGPAIAADGPRVVVAWFTGADGGSVKVAFSDDGGASFGDPIVVDPDQPPGRVDVALLEEGAAVTWLARAGGAGEVRARFVGGHGELGAPTIVGSTETARAAGFPVLAHDGERLLVAYRDGADPPRIHVAELEADALPRTAAEGEPEGAAIELLAEGSPVPEVELLAEDDGSIGIASLADSGPLLLAFFARWCQPCREELAALEELRGELGERATIVAVSLDEGSSARAEATARSWGFAGRVLRDGGAAAVFGAPPLPGLFLIDEGVVHAVWRGELADRAAIRERIEALSGDPG